MANLGLARVLTLMLVLGSLSSLESLKTNFYKKTCPGAEDLIADKVAAAIKTDVTLAAALLRIFNHDCFVQGCDASVLIDSPAKDAERDSGPLPEKALHLIDEVKLALEAICPKTVSCADIVAYSAVTGVKQVGGPSIDIQGGRLDGLKSRMTEPPSQLPSPFESLTGLKALFASKGLSIRDLVVLSGAHTIGTTSCALAALNPSMNVTLAKKLKLKCAGQPNAPVNFDTTAKIFDNRYFQGVQTGNGVFTSDAELYTTAQTRRLVDRLAADNSFFRKRFAASLIKMGQIGVKTWKSGNIRTSCRSFT